MADLAHDVNAIQNLKARYCAAADLSAMNRAEASKRLDDLLTENVRADYGGEILEGREAVKDFLCTAIPGNSLWMLHMLHSPLIEVADEGATGRWSVMVNMKRRATGVIDSVIGRYSDAFVREGRAWRISRVEFKQLT